MLSVSEMPRCHWDWHSRCGVHSSFLYSSVLSPPRRRRRRHLIGICLVGARTDGRTRVRIHALLELIIPILLLFLFLCLPFLPRSLLAAHAIARSLARSVPRGVVYSVKFIVVLPFVVAFDSDVRVRAREQRSVFVCAVQWSGPPPILALLSLPIRRDRDRGSGRSLFVLRGMTAPPLSTLRLVSYPTSVVFILTTGGRIPIANALSVPNELVSERMLQIISQKPQFLRGKLQMSIRQCTSDKYLVALDE